MDNGNGSGDGETVVAVIDPRVQNPAASSVLAALAGIAPLLNDIRETLERQERRSPGLFRIAPAGSDAGDGIGAQSTRLRVTHWVIAVSAAGQFAVRVGSAPVVFAEFAAAGTLVIPLPITIDSGKDISTDGVVANITDSYLLAFTE